MQIRKQRRSTIAAGSLRQRVTIQEPIEVSGELGEVDVTWQNITGAVQIPASVRPLRGREFFDSLQLQTEMSHVVRVRYIPGVTAKCRVLYDSRVLSIVAPPMDVDEEHRVLELACAEGVRDA